MASKYLVAFLFIAVSFVSAEDDAPASDADVPEDSKDREKRQQIILMNPDSIRSLPPNLRVLLGLQPQQTHMVLPSSAGVVAVPQTHMVLPNNQVVLAARPQPVKPDYTNPQTQFVINAQPRVQPVVIPSSSSQFVIATGQDDSVVVCRSNTDCSSTYAPAKLNCCRAQWSNTGCNCAPSGFCMIQARLPSELYFREEYCQPRRAQCSGYAWCGLTQKKKTT